MTDDHSGLVLYELTNLIGRLQKLVEKIETDDKMRPSSLADAAGTIRFEANKTAEIIERG